MPNPIGLFITKRGTDLQVQEAMFAAELADICENAGHVMKVALAGGYVLTVATHDAGVDGYPPYTAVTIRIDALEASDGHQ